MKTNISFTMKIIAIALVALVSCSFLFAIISAQEDSARVRDSGGIDNPVRDSGSVDNPVMDSGSIPPEVLPQEPECICTTLCTETEVNTDCPICKAEGGFALCVPVPKPACTCTTLCINTAVNPSCLICNVEGGFALCAYIPAPEALLERCNKLAAWYDGIVAADQNAVNAKGVLLSEADKEYFITEYEDIVLLANRMAPEQREQVTAGAIFLRLQKLYINMSGGYVVQYFSNDAILQKDSSVKNRMAAEEDEPSFQQECAPNTEYRYPDVDDAGLPEHPGYTFAGWSDSPDDTEALYQPGEPFKDLSENAGTTVRLYAVWARAAGFDVTLSDKSLNITSGQGFGTGVADDGADWTGIITPAAGYKLRANPISVEIDGVESDETRITCDDKGNIFIPKEAITGNIVITAFAVPVSYNVTLLNSPNVRDDGESFGADKAYNKKAWAGNLLMQGYHLTDNYNASLIVKVSNTPLVGECVTEITDNSAVPPGKGFSYTVNGDILIASAAVTGNITVQAIATANTYTIIYDKNGATGTETMANETRTYNSAQAKLALNKFTYAGYQFAGWSRSSSTGDVAYNNEALVNNLTTTDKGSVTLYAVWRSTGGLPTSIQNGSFEKPMVTIHTMTYQDTNAEIRWKTTLPSHKIEIGNGTHSSALNTYNLTKAEDGRQFAELNADDVGALYQNIATLPGSLLNWGLAHKCRGTNGATETMQVWIGSEAQVDEAIKQYKDAGNKVSGIDGATLAAVHQRTISDSYTDAVTWSKHDGKYTVPAGQFTTKFAFVSVSDISNNSYGNLLDNVYFSTAPPKPRTEVTVATTQGGNVTVNYAGNTISTLNSANPSYTGSLENGGTLKLYSGAGSGYTYNGAFLDGKYVPKTKLGAMQWAVGASNAPKEITVLYSKLRTLTFLPVGGAYSPLEETLGSNPTTYTVAAPTKPGFRFDGWKVVCPDLTAEQIETPPVTLVNDVIQYVTKAGVTSLSIKRGGSEILTIPGERGVNLLATYTAQKTQVIIDPNGGEYAPNKPLNIDMSLLNANWILTSPTREGYDFKGWKYTTEGTTNAKVYPVNTVLTYSASDTTTSLRVGTDNINAPIKISFAAQWETRSATVPTITAGTPANVNMVYGDTNKSLIVTTGAIPAKHSYSYQWYKNTGNSNIGGTAVAGATASGYSIDAKTAVGSSYYYCVVTATRTDTALSAAATSSVAVVTVTPKPVTLNWSTSAFAYDGTEKTITAAVDSIISGDTVAVTGYSNNIKTAAGGYTAVATGLSSVNYMLPASPQDRQSWSIGKKTPVLVPNAATMKFTDETASSKHDELTFKYSYDGDGTVSAASDRADIVAVSIDTATKTVVVRVKNPSTSLNAQISITLTATEGANYTAVTSVPVLLNIQLGMLIGGADGYTGVYDGLPHGILVKPMLDYPSEIFYGTAADSCTSPGSPTYRDVGTHVVYYEVKVAPIVGMLPGGLTIKGSKPVVISPAPLTATYKSERITYGATPALKVEITGLKNGETAAGLGVTPPAVSNSNKLPGVYTLTPAGGTPTANYTFAQYTSGTLTIEPASMAGNVTATGYTGVYDGLPHSITVNTPADTTVKYGSSADKCDLNAPPAHTNAGVYTVYYVARKSGYSDVSGSARVTINKAPLQAAFIDDNIKYGETASLGINVTGFVNGETPEGLAAAKPSKYTAPTVTNYAILPGVYQLTPEGGAADNYSFRYVSGVLTITAKQMSPLPTAADFGAVYDNRFHSIIINNIPTGATVTYGTAADNISLHNMPAYQNAGSYTIYYEVSRPGYEDVTGSAKLNITQRPVKVTAISVDDKVYDGTTAAANPVFTLDTQIIDAVTGDNKRGKLPIDILTADGTVVFADKNAGDDKDISVNGVTLYGNDALNYKLDTAMPLTTTAKITPKPVELTWYWGVGGTVNRVYDGRPSNVYAYVSKGLVQGDVCNITTDNGNQAGAGDHIVTAEGVTNHNYRLPTGTEPTANDIVRAYINTPAPLIAKCHNQTITFTPPGTAPTSFPIEVTGFVNGETSTTATGYTAPTAVLNPNWSTDWDGVETKEYKLIASGGTADNYKFSYQEGTLTVKKGNLHATVNNYIGDYDGNAHGVTVTSGAGMPTITTTYYADSNYNTALSTPPTFIDATGTAAVPGNKPVYYGLTATGLQEVKGTAYVQINPKPITAELVAATETGKQTKVYDGNTDVKGSVTVKLNGFIAGKEPTFTSKIDYASVSVGSNKLVNLTALTLKDNGAFKAGNYALSANPVSARFTDVGITAKPVKLVWGNNGATTYTGKARNPAVTAALADNMLVGADVCTVAVAGGTERGAGPHTATASLSNDNYKIEPVEPTRTTTYTINKRELTAVYKGETVTYGGKPERKLEVTGFAAGENEQNAAGYVSPTLTPLISDLTKIPVGTHWLTPADGSADNYEFKEYTKGTLTVEGISMDGQVLAFGYYGTYDGKAHGITVSHPEGSAVKYYNKGWDKDGKALAGRQEITKQITNVKESPLEVYYEVTMTNYAAVRGSETVVIEPKLMTASAENVTHDGNEVYNGSDKAKGKIVLRSLSAARLSSDESVVEANGTIRFTNADAGAAKCVNVTGITHPNVTNGNYILVSKELMNQTTGAEIKQKEVTLDWKVPAISELVYDGTAKKVTAAVKSGLIAGDICTVTVTGGEETSAGSYTATAARLSSNNYKLPAKTTQPYTITKAVIPEDEIMIDAYRAIYDHALHDSVTLSGTMEGDTIRYCIVAGREDKPAANSNWLSSVPRIGRRNSTLNIVVQVERPNYEPFIADAVEAHVSYIPELAIEAPQYYADNPRKVTIMCRAENPVKGKYIEYVELLYRKEGDYSYKELKRLQTEPGEKLEKLLIDYTFEDLEPNTLYEVMLSAGNRHDEGEQPPYFIASTTRPFITNPVVMYKGVVSGKVFRETTSTGKIDITLEKGDRVVASQKGLEAGAGFTLTGIADGEYNLVASDDRYWVTKAVTVKGGRTQPSDIKITIGARQTGLKSTLEDTPAVAVAGMDRMFGCEEIQGNTKLAARIAAATRNNGVAKIEMSIYPSYFDWESSPYLPAGSKVGVSLEPQLSLMVALSDADDMEDEPIPMHFTTGTPVELRIELPAEVRHKYDYRVFRTNAAPDYDDEELAEEVFSFSVLGDYVYITTDKFFSFALTYKDKPTGENGGGSGGSNSGSDSPFSSLPDESSSLPESSGAVTPSSSASSDESSSSSSDASAVVNPVSSSSSDESSSSGENPVKPDKNPLETKKEALKRELAERLKELIAGLPPSLTPAQRDKITAELNRIYADGIAAIDSGTTIEEVTAAYNEAVHALVAFAGAQRPFVLLSAIFALGAVALAVLTFFRKRGKKQTAAATVFAAAAVVVFLLTSGINDTIILANGYTAIVAVLCAGTAVTALYRQKAEEKANVK